MKSQYRKPRGRDRKTTKRRFDKASCHRFGGTGEIPRPGKTRRSSGMRARRIIWSLNPLGSPITPARRPSCQDRANHLGAAEAKLSEFKRGCREGNTHSRNPRRQVRHPHSERLIRDRRRAQGNNFSGSPREAMASSSSNNPTSEERLKALEDDVQHLKQLLQNQLDFLENLDIDAGRRLEMLEADITSTKFGLSEEIGKLHQTIKGPKQDLEDRVTQLEEKMAQLNKDWQQERIQPKKGGSK
jgi:hypothetical protein